MLRRSVAILASFLVLSTGPSAEAGGARNHKLRLCAAGLAFLGGAVAARWEARHSEAGQGDAISGSEAHWAGDVAGSMLGTAILPLNVIYRTVDAGISGEHFIDAARKTFRLDYGFVLANWALFNAFQLAYLRLEQLPVERFVAHADDREPNPPERVLILVSCDREDQLGRFAKFYAHNRFGDRVPVESFRSTTSLRRKLRSLANAIRRNPELAYDRVEIFVHGHPSGFQTGNGEFIGARRLAAELHGPYAITRAGAQMRVFSCSLGRNHWKPLAKGFRRVGDILAQAILPDGGTALLATRNLFIGWDHGLATGLHPPKGMTPKFRDHLLWWLTAGAGWGPLVVTAQTVQLYRNLGIRGAWNDVQEIRVEKAAPK